VKRKNTGPGLALKGKKCTFPGAIGLHCVSPEDYGRALVTMRKVFPSVRSIHRLQYGFPCKTTRTTRTQMITCRVMGDNFLAGRGGPRTR
jgi:hypothetical protein